MFICRILYMACVIVQTAGIESMAGVDDAEAEEVLAEFDFLVSEQSGEGAGEAQSHGDGPEWGMYNQHT